MALQRLKEAAENAKKELLRCLQQTTINLPFLYHDRRLARMHLDESR